MHIHFSVYDSMSVFYWVSCFNSKRDEYDDAIYFHFLFGYLLTISTTPSRYFVFLDYPYPPIV